MNLSVLVADLSIDPRLLDQHWLLTLAAGVVAGLCVVGMLHFLIRPRLALVPPDKGPQQPASDPFVHGSVSEQRKSFRRQGNPVEVFIVNPKISASPFKGYVIDRCVGGLGLYVEVSVVPGQQLTVRPINAPPITPWVEVIVKSCRVSKHNFELGCQFVKTPPWAVLLMFG
jgi:hypothetical protein